MAGARTSGRSGIATCAVGGKPDNCARRVKRDYLVPGQEQLRTALGMAEVRYYYPDDAERAEQLARDTMAADQSLGLAHELEIQAAKASMRDIEIVAGLGIEVNRQRR